MTRRESRLVPAIVPALLVLALAMTGDAWADRRAELLHLMQPHGGKAFRIDVSDAMLLGDPTTPVSTVVYFDFGCPICRGCYYKARQIVDQHPRKVHFYFKHWPLDRACNKGVGQTQHAASCRAAGAGTVATQQGKTREAMDYLFSKAAMGEPFSWFVLERLARTVGLRQKEWRARIESPATQALVVRDAVEGTELGFDGVPQVFVSGRYCEPAYMEKRILRAYGAAKKKQ